jgi:hypothetical protein
MNIADLTAPQLLLLHTQIGDELRQRGILRTASNPTGDLAEYLFSKAFGRNQARNCHINDVVSADGTRYQIRGRRMTRFNDSRQLSAIRDLKGGHFDFIAGVLFNEDYTVMRAALIPHAVVLERAMFVERTNTHKFLLRDDVWKAAGVRDVTAETRAVKL